MYSDFKVRYRSMHQLASSKSRHSLLAGVIVSEWVADFGRNMQMCGNCFKNTSRQCAAHSGRGGKSPDLLCPGKHIPMAKIVVKPES